MSGRIVLLIFILLFSVYANIWVLRAEATNGTIYIRSDGTIDPSTAPISRDGDLYVLNSDILSEGNGIEINRSNIVLDGASHTLEGSEEKGEGITLAGSYIVSDSGTSGTWNYISNVTIMNLTITHFKEGIYLFFSANSTIARNTIVENEDGIRVWMCGVETFYENNIIRNNHGVLLDETTNSLFFHNNFINNSAQVACEITPASYSTWDNGFPEGGNYWSNYNGTDEKNGKYQNETGSDGIGDTAYQDDTLIGLDVGVGSMSLRDNYPLMNPIDISNIADASQTVPETSFAVFTVLFLSITLFTVIFSQNKRKREIEDVSAIV